MHSPAAKSDPPGRVLVFGASGVVGSVLCKLLRADGWSVIGTTRTPEKSAIMHADGVEPVVVDALDADAVRDCVAFARARVIVHQLTDLPVGFNPKVHPDALSRNARIRDEGTRHLVTAAVEVGVSRIVAQSIAFVYAPGALPYTETSALIDPDRPSPLAVTTRGVVSLERQVLSGPFSGVVLRYGRFYGPGTGVEVAPANGPLHVEAAAHAARQAVVLGAAGVYNVAEADGTLDISKARRELKWDPAFRVRAD